MREQLAITRILAVLGLVWLNAAGMAAETNAPRETVMMNEDAFHYWLLAAGNAKDLKDLGGETLVKTKDLGLTRAGFERYVDRIAQGGVTHFLMNVNGQKAMYPSQALEPVWTCLDNPDLEHPAWAAALKDVYARGLDPFAIWIARCREKGVAPWLSIRMNDVHVVVDPKCGFVSDFWRRHPEWRVDPKVEWNVGATNIWRDWVKCAWEDGLDFTVPEVRARMLGFIREALERYDADGIEFDMLRSPNYLPKGRERETAPVLTAFMREVSAAVRAAAAKRGHAITRAVRVFTWPNDSQKRGLEVDVWAREGLIDAVIPCNFFFDIDFGIPVGSWRNWTGNRVKIYPGTDAGRMVDGRRRKLRYDEYLEWAAGLRARHADGFYLFNFFEQTPTTFDRVLKYGLKPRPVPPVQEAFEKRTFTDATGKTLNYRWRAPAMPAAGRRYPLVLLLHGAGERGSDNTAQLVHGAQQLYAYALRHEEEAYFIVPQVPQGRRWVEVAWDEREHRFSDTPSETMGLTLALVDQTLAALPVDPSRVYVTGLSMGGFGAWDALTRRPDLFAAALVNCGGGDVTAAGRIGPVPVWAWHGAADDVVPVSRSRDMVAALKAAGGNVRYTELQGVGHGVWYQSYDSNEALDWLFSQKRTHAAGAPFVR